MTDPGTSRHAPSRRSVLAVAVPLIVFVALAVWTDFRKDLWTDESFSLATSGHRPLLDTIRRATRFELQPPLYFSLLNLWLRVDAHIQFGRILSLLCAAGSVLVIGMTGRRLRLHHPALLFWMAALTPGIVWAATEMRVYGLVLLLVSIANFLFVTLVLTDDPRPTRTAIAYGVTALACLLTSYYTGFVLLGHWIGALLARRRRATLTTALFGVAIAFAPFVPTVLAQTTSHPAILGETTATFRERVYQTLSTWLQSILSSTPELKRQHAHALAAAVLMAPVFLWLVARLRASPTRRPPDLSGTSLPAAAVLGALVLVPTGILAFLRLTNLTLVNPRHMVLAVPGLLLWLGVVIDELPWPRAAVVASAALGALLVYCLGAYEWSGWQVADWRAAARYVSAHAGPTVPIVIAPAYEAAPFEYYYPWPASVVPVPGPARLDTADNVNTTIRDSTQLATVFTRAVATNPFWLVESERPTVAGFGRSILERFLSARYRVLGDTEVYNVSMRRLVAR